MTAPSKPRLAARLFWLGLLAGAVPIALQLLLSVRERSVGASLDVGALTVPASAGLLLLLAAAWVFSRRFGQKIDRSLSSVRHAVDQVLDDDFGVRLDGGGPSLEFEALSQEFNRLMVGRQREILNLKLEAKNAEALRESSRQLIQECIYAREPLAKQHPGLAAAYAAAAIRQAGQEKPAENPTVHGLVEGVDGVGSAKGNRENPRWTPKDVRVEVPMPSKLINMSVSGMAVESDRGLPVGGSWLFRVGTDAAAYEIPGKISWCRLERTIKIDDEVQPVYRTGVEFDDQLSGKAFDFFGPAALEGGSAATASAAL